ncbi:MAG: hypothetical protein DLM60_10820 [Pseudonocardiales bacterium]|nr:MAG: hypothetical protein DLM60_10820 [Pseudonocardiales bacterium]
MTFAIVRSALEPSDLPRNHGRCAQHERRGFRVARGAVLTALTAVGVLAVTGVAGAAPAGATAPTRLSGAPRCDDGPWTGAGASVEGRPSGFDAGDAGRTYVWHDSDGWHLRTTDARPGPHQYSGTITASPGARFLDVVKVRFEPGDRLWVDDHNTVHYSFTTYQGIDGIDFKVSACDGDRDREILGFFLQRNGHDDDPSTIDLGAGRHHPGSDPFTVHRTV